MRQKAFLLFSISLLAILLGGAFASAVGFGNLPNNREIIFMPGGEVRVPFYVINGERLSVSASSNAAFDPATLGTPLDDNINAYVSVDDGAPLTGPRQVEVVFRFPEHMRPGTYPVDVYATDSKPTSDAATVATVATVKFRLTVWVLSPDPLIAIEGVSSEPVAEGLDANATVWFVSRTVQDLQAVVTVEVRKDNITLARATARPIALPSGKRDSALVVLPTEELVGGEYELLATVAYADTSAQAGGILKIGTLHVGIPSHSTELQFNATNQFTFNITNQWNRELKDVYATVRLNGKEKTTASLDIPPFGQTPYEIYFDRDEALAPGPAVVEVVVTFKDYDTRSGQYADKQETFSLPVTIATPPIAEQPIALRDIIVWGLGIAVLGLIIVVFVIVRRREPPQQPTAAPPLTGNAP